MLLHIALGSFRKFQNIDINHFKIVKEGFADIAVVMTEVSS